MTEHLRLTRSLRRPSTLPAFNASHYHDYRARCAAEGLTPLSPRAYRIVSSPLTWDSMWQACRWMTPIPRELMARLACEFEENAA